MNRKSTYFNTESVVISVFAGKVVDFLEFCCPYVSKEPSLVADVIYRLQSGCLLSCFP